MRQSKFRRLILSTLLSVLFSLFSVQTTSACLFYAPLTSSDYELPTVVFEGEVIAIHPEIKLVPNPRQHSSEDKSKEIERVVGVDITFNVQKVIRGDLKLGSILVGWNRRGTHGYYPKTLSDFKRDWGTFLRVGLTTPDLFQKHCKEQDVFYGSLVKSNARYVLHSKEKKIVCSKEASGFYAKDAMTKFYVFSAGCFDEPYMISVSSNADGHFSK